MNKFILDESSFKALSSDSRVNILKALSERRRTLSELGKILNLKNSTIKEHCEVLMTANLIEKVDEGRKWKYYELTEKGEHLIQPNLLEGIKVFVMLCFGAVIFTGIILFAFQNVLTQTTFVETQTTKGVETDSFQILSEENNKIDIPPENNTDLPGIVINMNYNLFSILIMTVLIIGMFIGWLVGKKT